MAEIRPELTTSTLLVFDIDNTLVEPVGNIGSALGVGPVAIADTATVTAGGSVLVDVLANDGGSGLTVTGVTQPAHGSVVIQAGGLLYTPAPGYSGAFFALNI